MSTAPRLVVACALLLAAVALLVVAALGAGGRLPRNRWAGVRTRRTLASDAAFTLANRVAAAPLGAAGVIAVVGGVVMLAGGPAAVTSTVLIIATAGMLGLAGIGGALGDRAAARLPTRPAAGLPGAGTPDAGTACAGTCAGCDLVAGCHPRPS